MHLMDMISVIAEVFVAILGILMVIRKKKIFGWALVVTFGIYVFYDLTRFFGLSLSDELLAILFLIASLSILWGSWRVYKES